MVTSSRHWKGNYEIIGLSAQVYCPSKLDSRLELRLSLRAQRKISISRDSIDPHGQPPTRFADQIIDNRHRSIVISPIQIRILIPIGHDIRANIGIRLASPLQRTRRRIADTLGAVQRVPHAIQPRRPRPRGVHLALDATADRPTRMLLRNRRVPNTMQIGMHAVQHDGDIVSPAPLGLGVQGLVDVAEEMHHEAQALAAEEAVERRVGHAGSVVRDRRHNAPAVRSETVARHVDPALRRRRVARVNEVPPRRVREPRHVPHLVWEQRRLRDVLAVQQRVRQAVALRCEVHARQVGDCSVPQAAPCCCHWGEKWDDQE